MDDNIARQTRTAWKSRSMPDKHNAFILNLLYSENLKSAVIRGNHAIGLIDNLGCNPTEQLNVLTFKRAQHYLMLAEVKRASNWAHPKCAWLSQCSGQGGVCSWKSMKEWAMSIFLYSLKQPQLEFKAEHFYRGLKSSSGQLQWWAAPGLSV